MCNDNSLPYMQANIHGFSRHRHVDLRTDTLRSSKQTEKKQPTGASGLARVRATVTQASTEKPELVLPAVHVWRFSHPQRMPSGAIQLMYTC